MAGFSSSSSSFVLREYAFSKDCAPKVDPIGPYDLIDDCDFPGPPDPITTPTDPPIPIPPIDQGCYPLSIRGEFFGPGELFDSSSSAFLDGVVLVETTYPTNDPCEPDINLKIAIPCLVSFGADGGQVTFDPSLESATVDISARDAGDCDLGISISIGIPCPTELFGGAGTVRFDAETPSGSIELTTEPVEGTCDFSLLLNAVLPCPGSITARGNINAPCIPNPPSFSVNVNPIYDLDSSSSPTIPTCDFELQLNLDMPCPVDWPNDHVVTVEQINSVTPGSGVLTINPDEQSSSPCPGNDCEPTFHLALDLGCPVDFTQMVGSISLLASLWALAPDGSFYLSLIDDQVCSPELNISLSLPCPVITTVDSVGDINQYDSNYYIDGRSVSRGWAFGLPTAVLELSLGEVGGNETDCLPSLNISLAIPCPSGGFHRAARGQEERSLRNWRRDELYGGDDAHPYYDKIPGATFNINRAADVDSYGDLLFESPRGLMGKMELDDSCQLDLNVSLMMACDHRSLEMNLLDFDTGDPLDSGDGFAVSILQDFNHLVQNPCSFIDEVNFYMRPSSGSCSGNKKYAVVFAIPDSNGYLLTVRTVSLLNVDDPTEGFEFDDSPFRTVVTAPRLKGSNYEGMEYTGDDPNDVGVQFVELTSWMKFCWATPVGVNRPVRMFRVQSHSDAGDHLVCRTWDGETEGDEDILVLKPWDLRKTVWDGRFHTINGEIVNYAFSSDPWRRTATIGSETETQVIVPWYVVKTDGGSVGPSVIVAVHISASVEGFGQSPGYNNDIEIEWLDVTPGRAWARESGT